MPEESHGFSALDMFFEADLVVQAVLVVLLVASVWSWAVIIQKGLGLGGARARARKAEEDFWNGRAADGESRPGGENAGIIARIYAAASREWNEARRTGALGEGEKSAILDRASRAMRTTIDRELARVTSGVGVLASIGSVSPFIGLFGTVYGIMLSIHGISSQTNLAAVAPDIAEALFATALGLVAAIPATAFYNKYTSDANRYGDQLDVFSDEVLVRMSRKLSEAKG